MVPGTWLSVLFFFLFVAPGATFVLQSRRRRATFEESTFLEISRTVLASLGFTGFAIAVLIVVRDLRPDWMPQPSRLIARDGAAYFRDHYVVVVRAIVAGTIVACGAAWVANWLLGQWQGGPTIRPESAWSRVFRRDCPPDHDAYVRVRLADGVVYSGLVANFSTDLEVEGRELVLGQPLASKTGDGPLNPVPAQYQRVVLRGDSIEVMSVEYRRMEPPEAAAKRSWWRWRRRERLDG